MTTLGANSVATFDAVRGGAPESASRRASQARPIPAAQLVAAIDVVIVLASFFAMVIGINVDRMPNGLDDFLALRITVKNVLVITGFAVTLGVLFRWGGLYDASRVRRWTDEVRRILIVSVPITGVAAVVPLTGQSTGPVDNPSLLLFWAGTVTALVVARRIRASVVRGPERRRAIIVGTGPLALRIHQELCSDVLTSYLVLGFVDTPSRGAGRASTFIKRRTLGRLEDLETILVGEHVDEVYVGLPVKSHYRQIQNTIRTCEQLGVRAMYDADIFATELARPRVQSARDAAPKVQLQMAPDGVGLGIKRVIDIAGALSAIVLLSPVMLAAAAAIRSTTAGPVLFAQERYGLNRRRFRMFKFRTMVPEAEQLQASLESRNEASGPVFKIADDPRITPVGRFLRRTSIDEFPQFFNVLRGDMSLVGPRPLPLRDVARFTRNGDLRRFSMRPGITCLWQISGRSGVSFDRWVALDLEYIDRWSLYVDLRILALTVPAVLRGTGAK
jgi:exopolysaccharide biosynthesis polyprenyl glycosylphosphotransferase